MENKGGEQITMLLFILYSIIHLLGEAESLVEKNETIFIITLLIKEVQWGKCDFGPQFLMVLSKEILLF